VKGYAATQVFSDVALRDLEWATTLIARLPEKDFRGRLVRCHEVVRALQGILPSPLGTWQVQDGHYRTVDHTWLISPKTGHILDLYSIARFPMVQLLDSDIHFHRDLFRPGEKRRDIRHKVVKALWRAAQRV
jgi:hypothetical protein